MKILNNYPYISENVKPPAQDLGQTQPAANFKEILENKIIFSKHANTRLNSRDLNLSPEQLERVEGGITKAWSKGINESLVLVDDIALVVNVKNKLVITAMGSSGENIFTNIDGAVIV